LGPYNDIESYCMVHNELNIDDVYEQSIIFDVCGKGDVILTREVCIRDPDDNADTGSLSLSAQFGNKFKRNGKKAIGN
jgi:hypothetical protein